MKMINEDRLFSLLKYFFERPSQVIYELCQNAMRSGAKRVDIAYDKDKNQLEVIDDGKGIKGPASLVILAEADWNEKIMRDQMPAGWGMFYLYAISDEVTIASKFGTLKIDCQKFLYNRSYREGIFYQLDVAEKLRKGTRIFAKLKPEVEINFPTLELGWFPMDIYVNGEKVGRKQVEDVFDPEYYWKCEYKGNTLLITRAYSRSVPHIIWYGISIEPNIFPGALYIVTKGNPVTPKLPYRDGLVEDDKLKELQKFIKNKWAEFALQEVNKNPAFSYCHDLMLYCPEVAEKADKWLIRINTANFDDFYWDFEEDEIVDRNSVVKVDDIKITVDGNEIDSESVVFPRDSVRLIASQHPSWVKAERNELHIDVKTHQMDQIYYPTELDVYLSDIKTSDGRRIPMILYEDTIYVSDLDEPFPTSFLAYLHNPEDMSFDVFEYELLEVWKAVREKLRGKPSLQRVMAGVNPWVDMTELKEVTINAEKRTMTIIRKNGQKIIYALD